MLRIILTTLFGLGLLLAVLPVQAADFRTGDEKTGSVTVNDDEAVENLHVSGQNIIVNSDVKGDLLAAGNTISITGDVENSLFVAAADVTIRGNVGHHARIAANNVTLSGGTINGDVFIAANQVTIAKEVTINGELYASANEVTINGIVKGRLRIGANKVTISNSVGPVSAQVNLLSLQSGAIVNGDLEYRSREIATIASGAQITGETDFTKTNPWAVNFNYLRILTIIGTFILAWLLVRFRRDLSHSILRQAIDRPHISIGIGIVALLGLPILAVLLLITVIGLPIGVLLGFLWILALLIGSLFGKLILGSWLMKTLTKEKDYQLDWQALAAGIVIANLFFVIPIVGDILGMLITLLGLGAVVAHAVKPTAATK